MRRAILLCVFFASYASAVPAHAAPGDLDPTFGFGGKVTTPSGTSADAEALVVQPDGRIVAAGSSFGSFQRRLLVLRYKPNGKLDKTFGGDGMVHTAFAGEDADAQAVAVQPDGRIVVAGYIGRGMGAADFVVARYKPSGRLDRSFSGDGKRIESFGEALEFAYAVVIQTDGKIVVGGSSGSGADEVFALARYRTNGTLDPTFGSGGKVTTPVGPNAASVSALALQADGKLIAAGLSSDGSKYRFAVVRYLRGGALDPGFGAGGKRATAVGTDDAILRAMALQPNGKIVVGGWAIETSSTDFALARYDSGGTLDPRFGTNGTVITPTGPGGDDLFGLAVQPDGNIVAAGSLFGADQDFGLLRYTPRGTLDTTFGTNGRVRTAFEPTSNEFASGVALQRDGRIVAAGHSGSEVALVRYLPWYPEVSVRGGSKREGDTGTSPLVFRVRLDVPPGSSEVTVRYTTAEGTAHAPQDFRVREGVVEFTGARTLRRVKVPIVGDRRPEPNEWFRLAFSSPSYATLGQAWATGRIIDDD